DGSVTGTAFHASSGTEIFPVPNVGVTQDLSELDLPATLGLGLTVVSGIGAEFRSEPGSLGAGAEFIIFGVNAGLGYALTENLSVGATATISFAQSDGHRCRRAGWGPDTRLQQRWRDPAQCGRCALPAGNPSRGHLPTSTHDLRRHAADAELMPAI
ncbi:MAG: hypothetical protein GVY22_17350, partial [Gammaproteobacteria bacterium]|nr:hypothetical protein [Gammaproteobacteria bacterium]